MQESWTGLDELGDTFLIQLGREQDRDLLNVDAIVVYGLVTGGRILIVRAALVLLSTDRWVSYPLSCPTQLL